MKIFKNNSSRRGFLGAAALLSTGTPRLVAEELIKRPTAAAEIWARTELYFGTNKLQAEVTDSEFATFVDAEVTKRFPEGLTLLTGYGQFRNSSGALIREKSHVLILFYPLQTHDANGKIQEIRELYKDSYQQESVLRVDSLSFVSF